MRLIEELRKKYPGLAKKEKSGSRAAAIRLYCLECLGGSAKEVKECDDTLCPLHQFRMGKREES